MILRVLALWQPYASLCVVPDPARGTPAKVHETRHWDLRSRGSRSLGLPVHVAIHATKTLDYRNASAFDDLWPILNRLGYRNGAESMPFGQIVGIATIVRVVPTVDRAATRRFEGAHADDYQCGDFSAGRFAWQLADARPLPTPIPHRGRQDALYALDAETQASIYQQLMRGD